MEHKPVPASEGEELYIKTVEFSRDYDIVGVGLMRRVTEGMGGDIRLVDSEEGIYVYSKRSRDFNLIPWASIGNVRYAYRPKAPAETS